MIRRLDDAKGCSCCTPLQGAGVQQRRTSRFACVREAVKPISAAPLINLLVSRVQGAAPSRSFANARMQTGRLTGRPAPCCTLLHPWLIHTLWTTS